MNRVVAVLLLLVGCLVVSGCGRGNKLIIGTDATYPPFEVLDEKGEFSGADMDMGRELAKHLGKEVEFQNINFDGLMAALKSGAVDLVISGMSATDERRQSIDFSDPYVKTGIAMLVYAPSPVQSLEDLKAPGRKVVVRLATTGQQFAEKYLPNTERLVLDSDTACVLEVTKGGADVWIYDQVSLMRYNQQHPKTTRVVLKPLREEYWAVGLRKGNDELRLKVNEFIAKFRAEGGFKRLEEKHMTAEKAMMDAQGIPFVYEMEAK